ncbi:MAG: hypothetical protein ACK4G2_02240 [Novosphingobium sp.]
MNSAAYADLSNAARCLLFDLVKRFNGHNNGDIAMSHREARALLRVSPRKVTAAFDELLTHGFIELAAEGTWREREAREYRLCWLLSGKAPPYRPPTLAYRGWAPDAPAMPIKRQRAAITAGRPPRLSNAAPADQSSVTAAVAPQGKDDTAEVAEERAPVTAPVAAQAEKPRKSGIPEIGPCYRSGDAYKLPCPPAPANQPGQGDGGHGEAVKGANSMHSDGKAAGRKCHPLPPAESKAKALREGAGGKGALRASGGALGDWRAIERADPKDVCAHLAAGDARAADLLAGMSEAEALAAADTIKRTLGAWRPR